MNDQTRFDFAAWVKQLKRHSFEDCLRAAVDCLALDDGNIRERIVGAIFCLRLCRSQDIPERWRPEVEAILDAIHLRGGGGTLRARDLDYRGLREWARRCKLRTARRIARTMMKIHWAISRYPRRDPS